MIQDTLNETKKIVWPEIEKHLKDPKYPAQFLIPAKFKKEVNLYWKINKEYPERKGKYLRPTLVLLTASALGVNNKLAIKIASAMQLSEEWILISDDIEDKSEKRRDKPTLHKMYGVELAINASDTLEAIMWKIVADCKNTLIFDEFYKIILRTTLGQGVEQIWTNKKQKLTDERYFFVADSKSAYYSMAGPMRLGAIVAGATKHQLNKITEFGLHLGRCFQLVDDILDLEQDKKEGKSTLANTKGIEYTKKQALKEKDIAKEIFEKDLRFLSHEPARTKLRELIEFILERKY
ncbi:MAG TPA: polyprenyl synthetase family protein [Patescibacteria group bacterium]|nr:polyprenyl synthetase family protein [Patescibacteria group bacterium]